MLASGAQLSASVTKIFQSSLCQQFIGEDRQTKDAGQSHVWRYNTAYKSEGGFFSCQNDIFSLIDIIFTFRNWTQPWQTRHI